MRVIRKLLDTCAAKKNLCKYVLLARKNTNTLELELALGYFQLSQYFLLLMFICNIQSRAKSKVAGGNHCKFSIDSFFQGQNRDKKIFDKKDLSYKVVYL